ncbi:hypothetical protein [Streptomyces neyagawaensis]|uniref:hypothetical protein n=1 Tax=Streptomyces neyagawaensis TaxID=42238 RepID=UPI0006E31C50|nr:hypothetical protein [Streptomyces neyagawaensis]MCL6736232.1 hypothetical protein [Streptomyces neyagawaensis]MDE1684193.1 hypothetical protein [Streptomyces neyagawaensis]
MPDVYGVVLDAELGKAFDVWSSYLDARTGEDEQARGRLRSMLESAREQATAGEHAAARRWLADMYDEAREVALPWAPTLPRPCEADRQTRDYVKDTLSRTLPPELRDRLDAIALSLSVTGRRLQRATGIDAATRQDVLYLTARAGMALDLAHPAAAQRELDRLTALARRCGVEP